MYCDLPKAGSSVWMKIMLFLSQGTAWRGGNVHKESMVQNTFLYSYLPDDQIEMLKTHYKFMFVRHPFERLLSGFRNKVFTTAPRDRWTRVSAVCPRHCPRSLSVPNLLFQN